MIRLIHGDNLEGLRTVESESVTLAYLDPPFFTQRDFQTTDGRLAYSDKWRSFDEYLKTIGYLLAVVAMKLAPWGSCVIHVDPRVAAYVRIQGDEVFGRDHFASEIIWRYRRWPSKQKGFQRIHDVLLHWRSDPSSEPRWTQLYEPLAPSTVKTWGKGKQRAVVEDGHRTRSSTTEEDSPGVPMGDVWDIPIVAPSGRERTSYPTQKPEALLERLILALTHEGDTVLDPYCGSGTSCAVARRLGRRSVGIDSSAVALEVARKRLRISDDAAA